MSESLRPLPGGSVRPGIFGSNALDALPSVVRDLGITRVLLVTGKQSFAASGAARIVGALREVATVETWSDFAPNPDVRDVMAGADVVRSFRPDAVVAIGGGSALDVAKLLAALADTPASDIPDRVRSNTVEGRATKLLLVPTTSGSGSEATHFAVAYIGEEKYSVADPALLPDFVILDPVLTESASPYQKATSVVDAVAQAVESMWARGATSASRAFARSSLEALVPSAPRFVHGQHPAAEDAARGSYLAGRAIDVSKTTGAHAMAYALTKRHGLSHGHAVAVTLGAFARQHAARVSARGSSAALRDDLETLAQLCGADSVATLGDRLDTLAGELGLELRLSALGVPREDLAVMAGAVNVERLGNNPVAFTAAELGALLDSCW